MKDEFLATVSHELRTPLERDPRVGADPRGRRRPTPTSCRGARHDRAQRPVPGAADRRPAGHEPDHLRQAAAGDAVGGPRPGGRRPPSRRVRPTADGQGDPAASAAGFARRPRLAATRRGSSRWSGTCCPTPSSSRPRAARSRCCWSGSNLARRDHRERHGRGHRPGVPAARVRAVPPGRRVHHPTARRAGAGAVDRQATSRAPRRRRDRPERREGQGLDVRPHPPAARRRGRGGPRARGAAGGRGQAGMEGRASRTACGCWSWTTSPTPAAC